MVLILSGLAAIGIILGALNYIWFQPRRWASFASVLLLAFALSIVYTQQIAPSFGYQGFTLSLSWERFLLSLLLLVASILFVPVAVNRPSDFLVQVWYLMGYFPILLLFMMGLGETNYLTYVSLCLGLIILFQRNRFTAKFPKLKQISLGYWLGLMLLVYTYGALILSQGLVLNLSLLDVYDIRSDFVAVATSYPFLSYFAIWQGYVINPLLLSVFLEQKKYLLSAAILFLIFLLFSISGLKNLLSVVFFVFLILFFIKPQNSLGLLSSSLSLLVISSGYLMEITGRVEFISYSVRRLFYLPALLNYQYYEFFSVNPKAKLGHSLLSNFVDYPYDLPPSGIIASYIDPTKTSGANAGFLADAYANFGFIGMVGFTFLFIFLLKIIDSISLNRDWRFATIAVIMPFFALINSGLLTTLLSHGFLFALFLYWVISNWRFLRTGSLVKSRLRIRVFPKKIKHDTL